MNQPNKLTRLFLFTAVFAGTLWTGTYLLRHLLTYRVFEGTELTLTEYIHPGSLPVVFNVLNPAVVSTFIFYAIFIISFILYLVTSRINLKKNGWLFIIVVLVFITAPFEIYLMTIDYKILVNLNYSEINSSLISELFKERIKVLSSFPLIELFSYFTFYYLILFKPFAAKTL